MPAADALPTLAFATLAAWEAWLEANHAASSGVWLKLAKAGAKVASVTYPQALDAALCFGWIDGQKQALDDTHWLQRFTPRAAKSKWSKINCAKAEALVAAGRMRAAGQREIDRAREDGRWEAAYDGQRRASVPPDFEAALERHPRARAFFATLNSANRYSILYRLQDAKRPETRAKRLETFIAMLEAKKKFHG